MNAAVQQLSGLDGAYVQVSNPSLHSWPPFSALMATLLLFVCVVEVDKECATISAGHSGQNDDGKLNC